MKRLLSLLVLCSTILVAAAQEKYLLRFNPEIGKTTTYEATFKMEADAQGLGKKNKMLTNLFMKVSAQALKREGKNIRLSFSFLEVKGSQDVDGWIKGLDEKLLEQFEGKSFECLVNELGKPVEKVDLSSFGDVFKDISFDQLMGLSEFPEQAVAVGDTWQKSTEIRGITTSITYQLESVSANSHVITTRSTLSKSEDGAKLEGTGSSKSSISRKTGINIPGTSQAQSNTTITIPQLGMTLNMKTTVTM